MLVVPELEKEVELLWELRDTRKVYKNKPCSFYTKMKIFFIPAYFSFFVLFLWGREGGSKWWAGVVGPIIGI